MAAIKTEDTLGKPKGVGAGRASDIPEPGARPDPRKARDDRELRNRLAPISGSI